MTDSLNPHQDDALMSIAWADCLRWALSQADIREAFRRDTGYTYAPPRNRLDAMIDEATGYGEVYVREFVLWFNVNVWGDPYAEPADDDSETTPHTSTNV